MIQKIWRTDFSPPARTALRFAIKLGRALSASVEVLHVIPPRSATAQARDAIFNDEIRNVDSDRLHEAERELVKFVSSVEHDEVALRYWVDPGDPAGSIVQEATAQKFDLIVMSTQGRTGLSATILGSVAQAVVSCAPCPVTLLSPSVKPS